jgi:hypothetical protein
VLFQNRAAELMTMWPTSTRMSKPANDDATMLEGLNSLPGG